MVNLDNLQNINTINITTNLTGDAFLDTAVTSANTQTDGFFGLIIGIAIYISIMYMATKQDSLFALDFIKASVLGSGLTLTFMILLLALDMISSYVHLMYFVIIFIISVVIAYVMREKE